MSRFVSSNAPTHAGMQYLRSYTFLFSAPHAASTISTLSLYFILPVVGQLAVWGYCYNLIEQLIRRGEDETPSFVEVPFNHLISRSAWPGMLMLLIYFSVFPLSIFFTWTVTILSIYAAFNGSDIQAAVFGVGFPLVATLAVIGVLFLSGILLPMTLRMALTQSLLQAFRFRWLWEFWKKMWFELLLSVSFLWVSFFLVVSMGAFLFCFGAIPAMVLCTVAQAHLQYQLYELYLRRGGTPIPVKSLPPYAQYY